MRSDESTERTMTHTTESHHSNEHADVVIDSGRICQGSFECALLVADVDSCTHSLAAAVPHTARRIHMTIKMSCKMDSIIVNDMI